VQSTLLKSEDNAEVELIIAPYGFGGTDNLAQEGAHSLIEKELDKRLEAIGSQVSVIEPPRLGPFQIQEEPKHIRNIESIVQINSWLAKRVSKSIKDKKIPILLGGDGSLSIASIKGAVDGLAKLKKSTSDLELGVIWLNNHLCNSSPKVTKSWNANRMAFSAVTFEGDLSKLHPDFATLISLDKPEQKEWQAILNKKNIVHIGVSHKSAQAKVDHNYLTMEDIAEFGVRETIKTAITLLDHCEKIHIVWDVNSLDLRGVSNYSLGQLNYREALGIAREIDLSLRKTGKLSSIDIVEHCPSREAWDKVGETAEWMTDIISNVFGENIFNCLRKY